MSNRRISPRRVSALTLCLLGLVALGGAEGLRSARAEAPIHTRWKGFKPSGRYVLVRDRKPVEGALILHSRKAAAFLILDPGYEGALLVDPRTSTIKKIETDDILRRDDGTADVLASAKITSLGRLRRSRRDLQIRVAGYAADLQPNPPLLAWQMCNALKVHSPEYLKDAKSFELNADALKKLEGFKPKARVNVYFGSWCPTCSRYLGRIMRLERALADTGVEFHYYGLPKPPKMYRDAEVRRHRIRKIPTGIIYKEQKKLGTIVSTRWNKPAVELAKLLLGDG